MATYSRQKRVTLRSRIQDALEASGHKLATVTVRGVVVVDWRTLDRPDDRPHRGPRCVRCGADWCMYCWDDGAEKIETCRGET
jgi:hypothetical protein